MGPTLGTGMVGLLAEGARLPYFHTPVPCRGRCSSGVLPTLTGCSLLVPLSPYLLPAPGGDGVHRPLGLEGQGKVIKDRGEALKLLICGFGPVCKVLKHLLLHLLPEGGQPHSRDTRLVGHVLEPHSNTPLHTGAAGAEGGSLLPPH